MVWGAISREENWALSRKHSLLPEEEILATCAQLYFKIVLDQWLLGTLHSFPFGMEMPIAVTLSLSYYCIFGCVKTDILYWNFTGLWIQRSYTWAWFMSWDPELQTYYHNWMGLLDVLGWEWAYFACEKNVTNLWLRWTMVDCKNSMCSSFFASSLLHCDFAIAPRANLFLHPFN